MIKLKGFKKFMFLLIGIFGLVIFAEGVEDFLVPILHLQYIWSLNFQMKLIIGITLLGIAMIIGNINFKTIKKNSF